MLVQTINRLKSFIQTSSFLSGVLTILFSLTRISSLGQDFTNKGMEFYVCFPPQVITGGTNFPNMSLFITSDNPSQGQVVIPGSATPVPFTLTTTQPVKEIPISYSGAYFGDGTGSFLGKGIRVVVDPGQSPVVVYAHIYVAARSAASLILPTAVLGKKYITANCYQKSNDPSARSQFQVVAVEDNTQLKITPHLDGVAQPSFTTTLLNKGDIFQYQSTQDLTGSLIESVEPGSGGSCKRIAVFSGSSAVYIETSTGCSLTSNITLDPLFQQLFPINSWGKKYAFVPFADYVNGNPYRVIAAEDGTAVYENGNFKATINAGGYYQSMNPSTGVMDPINAPVFITASKPVSVVQYAQMARCRGASPYTLGDPEMLLLNPINQGVNNITVFSSLKENITERFIQVVIKQEAAASFKINNGTFNITSPWVSMLPVSEGYVYNQIPIPLGLPANSFTLTANQDFVASVYGFGLTESYAYSAGANFKDLSQTLNTLNRDTLINFPASCTGTPMKFSITSPYRVRSIKWDFSDFQGLFTFSGGALDTTFLPVLPATLLDFDSTWPIDGKSFYRYDLKKFFTIPAAVEKTVKVTADIINPDGCSGVQEITYKLKIYDPPVARIKQNFSGAVCLGSPVNLTDSSEGKGRAIQKSIWVDLSDGGVSTGPSWSKTYSTSGSKRVGHIVLNDIGCVSDTSFELISVNALPVADFAASSVICDRRTISFSNTSVANAGGVSALQWTLPNGTTSTASSVSFGFASPGTPLIRLRITNSNGCVDVLDSTLTVFPTPGAFFELPKICKYDQATFNGVSNLPNMTISDYVWTIAGVPYSGQSIDHTFAGSGPQLISLKTVSDNGCDSTITRTLV
ncbi:MAG: PKD domain-containing protein, partial [Chitinophagaceae bacterium]